MPAPDTATLRNFRGNFRAATLSLLLSAETNVALERSLAKLNKTARIEVTFDLGEAMNQETLPSGLAVYDFFSARLRLRVVTARPPMESSPSQEATDLHELFVARCLDTLAEERAPYTEALLPYYAVKTIRPLGTRSDLDLTYLEDFTDVDFALEFGIRSTAWPTEYTATV